MDFRLATLSDLPQLIELRVLMQKEAHGAGDEVFPADYRDVLESYFKRAMPAGSCVCFVAEESGQLVSTTALVIYERLPALSVPSGRTGYVSNVYTLPEFRARGLATRLMEMLVEECRKCGVEKVTLGATDAGIGVYERVGFRRTKFPQLELKLAQK